MKKQALDDLLTTLEGEGVVLDREKIGIEARSDAALYSNLAVKILSIFGGVIGSFFLVIFLLVFALSDSAIGMIVFGGLVYIGALVMSRNDTSVFLDTINISLLVVGVGTIGVGVGMLDMGENIVVFAMILLGTLTFFFSERFLLRFLSGLLIAASLVGFAIINKWDNLVHLIIIGTVIKMTYLHLYEAKIISSNKFFNTSYAPLRLALVFSLIGLLFLVGKGGRMNGLAFNYLWVSSITIIGATLFSIYKIMDNLEIEKSNKMLVMALATVIFIPTIYSPFISGAILILILNYHIGHRTGIALGVVTLIYSVSQYYYDLNLTLLYKSGVLVLSGLLFLIAYYIFQKNITRYEQN